jgi:hypothetical protein
MSNRFRMPRRQREDSNGNASDGNTLLPVDEQGSAVLSEVSGK